MQGVFAAGKTEAAPTDGFHERRCGSFLIGTEVRDQFLTAHERCDRVPPTSSATVGCTIGTRLAAFEPAFVDELSVIMRWAFNYMRRGGDSQPSEQNWLRDETGGALPMPSRVVS